jgi:signal transduction histidine kinase/ActR/RegA family two-component response regulator
MSQPSEPAPVREQKSSTFGNFDVESILENVFDFYGMLESDGTVISLKGEIFKETSVNPELLRGEAFAETVFWQSSPNTARLLERSIKEVEAGDPSKTLLDFRLTAARKIAVELYLHPVRNETGYRIFFSGQQVKQREETVDYYKSETEGLLFAAENADIGLWYWDLINDKIFSTPKCNELFEVPAYEKLTYERFIGAVHPEDRDRVAESLLKAHENGTKYTEEYRVVYSDGSIEWIAAEGKSFLDDNGRPSKMTSVVRNVTEEKLAAEELALVYEREMRAREDAVEANRSKDLFLAFVSHELRSPLNAILGWSKILLTKTVDDETRRNALETIERSARIQTKLINDLVDSARVASGKIRLEFRPVNLYEIVRVSYHAQKPAAEARNVRLEFSADDESVQVFGDSGRLQQVFGNLISNALKFTPEGGFVSIELTRDEDSAEVTVHDSGRGISSDALPNIFRQFAQGDLDKEKSKIGLGLGLSIVKILVNKHGGDVVAESEGLGLGSTFRVTLPITQRKPEEKNEIDELPANDKVLAGVKVLLVEDDVDSREVLQLFLEQNGALVISSDSADDAVSKLRTSKEMLPDVILSDLAMPGGDGYSMIKRIRELPAEEGGRVPAIALSAFASNDNKKKALESGFQKYSTKPFEPDHLIPAIVELAHAID